MGETPDSTELRMCWCRVGLRSGIPPLSLLSFFGLRFLLCIPTISALLFFPSSTTPANTCNASPPPPGSRPASSGSESTQRQLLVSVATAPHCTASHHHHTHKAQAHGHRHTTTAGWAKLCVPPVCPFRVFPHLIIGVGSLTDAVRHSSSSPESGSTSAATRLRRRVMGGVVI